ncbi:T9SS type A sorting domain-containing protein, partial [Bacteroidota bacterium]
VQVNHQISLSSGDILKSLNGSEILFPDEFTAFEVDADAQSIRFITPEYTLNSLCQTAINRAPKWLKEDLHRQFRKLRKFNNEDEFANLIINSPTEIVDEVAFQIANLSFETLRDSRFRSTINMLIDNAQFIYDVVDSLKYVRLVEHGTFASGDYYTTAEYRIKDGTSGDTIWSEIPKEIYYWYLVMPKIDREGVYKQDQTSSTQFRTYGYFWRNFIWYNPDPNHDYTQVNITTAKGSVDTIQRFGALMQQPEVLWNRVQTYLPFGRTFDASDHALDMLGNWASRSIPIDAKGNRPFEPNQVLYEHDGNCHEDAILIAAACRTALIPVIHVAVHGEDHAFCMIWDEDWYHYEFFRGGFSDQISPSFAGITNMMDKGSYGWTSTIAHGSRPDGYLENQSEYYSDKICTLKVQVTDTNNKPVDGAKVIFWCSPAPYSSGWQSNVGFAWTDHTGTVSINVGAGKKFAYQVFHPGFNAWLPSQTEATIINSTNSVNGQTYTAAARFTDFKMPSIKKGTLHTLPSTSQYGLHVDFTSEGVIAGTNTEDVQNSQFAFHTPEDGSVSFFICDQLNYDKFKNKEAFDYYYPVDYFNSGNLYLPLPYNGKWYVVFSNQEATINYQQLDATVELISDAVYADIADVRSTKMTIFPNPFTTQCRIHAAENTEFVEVYDLFGKLVTKLEQAPFIWQPQNDLSKGIYLVRTYCNGKIQQSKVQYQ